MIRKASGRCLWRNYGFIGIIVCMIPVSNGISIDNEVIGIPQVQCSEDAVTFAVRTRNPFTGNIYIKGKFNEPACRQEFFSNTFNGASYTVRIPLCGMRRIRQFNTKIDKAYNVRCFYAQQEKTITSQLEVSMLSTQNLEAATMLMPNCEYSIRSGSLNGPRVRYVRVGDRLVHRWECDNPNFGMLIKNCFVNDGYGSSVRVLDSRGCPVFTPVIQGPLQYDNSLNLAYVEVWAYKFPDRQDLYFQCQVQVCNKRENECVGITPPNCPLTPRPVFTPSSIVEPYVTGPYGPVTIVHGTFIPGQGPFIPGQEVVVGPLLPGVQPAPYGPPFGQQVLPVGQQVLPVGQQVLPVGQQVVQPVIPGYGAGVQAPIGSQIVGVPYPGGYGYGAAASDEGANANAGRPLNVARGSGESVDQSINSQSITTPVTPATTVHSRQPHEFNADIRNDDSQSTHSTPDSTVTPINSTFVTPRGFPDPPNPNPANPANPRLRLRSRNQVQDKRKSRRDAIESENKRVNNRATLSVHQFTNPGPVEDGLSDGTTAPIASQGDVHLMDVTAEMVYVTDVGDNDSTEDLKHYPFSSVSSTETKQICLNPLAFSLLFSCFAVLVITIALLLVYLLMKSGRWSFIYGRNSCESRDDGVDSKKWVGAETLSTSSTRSMPSQKDDQCTDESNGPRMTTWTMFPNDTKDDQKSILSSIFPRRPFGFSSRERLQAS